MRFVVLALALASACRTPLDEVDGAFYSWDNRPVHCAIEVDDVSDISEDEIFAGLDRARDNGEVLELLVHTPGVSMGWTRLEAMLAGVHERGLPFLTATDLVQGTPQAGVALMYDDSHTQEWTESMTMLARYDARVTLYVSRYPLFSAAARDQLRRLADAGHDVQAHSVTHPRGPQYVEEHGLRTYVDDEVLASIDALRADGYEVLSYAYPFGAHTAEMDKAIEATGSVSFVRSLAKTNELRANPCRE